MIVIITTSDVIRRPKIQQLLANGKWYASSFIVKSTNRFKYSKNKTHCTVTNNKFQMGYILDVGKEEIKYILPQVTDMY